MPAAPDASPLTFWVTGVLQAPGVKGTAPPYVLRPGQRPSIAAGDTCTVNSQCHVT
jgi:hypothetical protein